MPEQPTIVETQFDPEDEYRPEPPAEPLPPVWMDGSLRVGIHTSIAGAYVNALESARRLGCNALQIFSASPRIWHGGAARIPDSEAAAFRARRDELGLGPLVVHSNYLINLASPENMLRTRSIQAFHEELVRAMALGADFVLVHPGSRGDARIDRSILTVIESVKQAAKRLPPGRIRVLIENTAGMAANIGGRLEEIAEIVRGLAGLNVGACLDTAHLFASGYDIRTEAGLAATLAQIDSTIGLERVPVLHINDSKIPLGGRVDRHEHIGKGKIGAEAFERLLRHPRLGAMPPEGLVGRAFIAETPIEEPGDDRKNVAKLWELAGIQGPEVESGFSMMTPALKKTLGKMVKHAATKKRAADKEIARKKSGDKSAPRRKRK